MVKSLFLEFRFGDRSLEGLTEIGINHLMIAQNKLNQNRWQTLEKMGMKLSISVNAFEPGGCPLAPQARAKLHQRIKKALAFKPTEIWLDHFRFDGHWEAIKGNKIPGIHPECQWCQRKERIKILVNIAHDIKKILPEKISLGYFAVPFKENEMPDLISVLGQDHHQLAKVFDRISPMLYHRMIKKPVEYIHDYTVWLHNKTQRPILPIIQVKDMPDDLPDSFSEKEIKAAFQEAAKSPSIGVAFFCWGHAIEKRKTSLIKNLFSRP